MADYSRFWSALAELADTFRREDPRLTGSVRQLAAHLGGLPSEEQAVIRTDLQLVVVELSQFAVSLAVQQVERQSSCDTRYDVDSDSDGRLRASLPQRTS